MLLSGEDSLKAALQEQDLVAGDGAGAVERKGAALEFIEQRGAVAGEKRQKTESALLQGVMRIESVAESLFA